MPLLTCALWSGHGGVARCRRRVRLQDDLFVAVRVVCGHAGATVPLQGVGPMCRALPRCYADAVVKVFSALWSGHAAATWCAVLPGVRFGAVKLMPLQGAAWGA